MLKTVPIKNISRTVVDVKKPNVEYARSERSERIRFASFNKKQQTPLRLVTYRPKRLMWSLAGTTLIGLIVIVYLIGSGVKEGKTGLIEKGGVVLDNFSRSIEAFQNLNPEEAKAALVQNNESLLDLAGILERPTNQILMAALEKIFPMVKNAGGLLKKTVNLNSELLKLSELLSDLQLNSFGYFQNDGEKLIAQLSATQDSMEKIRVGTEEIRNTTSDLKNISGSFSDIDKIIGEDYLKYNSDIQNWNEFLGNLITLIKENNKHIVLLFQNPAEIRPGGGFIGSYADLTISGGKLQDIDVRDIYDPDGQFFKKIIPPEPLQGLSNNWGARDANWFFDFPTSAKTVVGFLEQSKIYEERGVKFELAIALNINIIKTILAIIGPIPLPEYKTTITSDNFLNEVQREVESGKDKIAGEPKKILKVLTPIILDKLNGFSSEEKQKLMTDLREHLKRKDIMVFAKDKELASFFKSTNIDGGVYELPNGFWGSYLAVVNANIAGGKSDVFVKETIDLRLDVDTDGGVFGDLTIERKHEGDKEKDFWWRATNKDYIQVFVNPGSTIVALKGNDTKISTKREYTKDFEIYPELDAIEKTKLFLSDFQVWTSLQSGKNVFGTWLNTPAGKTKTMNLRYQASSADKTVIVPGKKFRFVFERQSGVENTLKLTIGAPLGYTWLESKSSMYFYETEDPEARTIIDLTLEK
ncbi:MAG: DUF4012 domain-containing protein [Patescibacteria group bacterium]|mgnify:FL=1